MSEHTNKWWISSDNTVVITLISLNKFLFILHINSICVKPKSARICGLFCCVCVSLCICLGMDSFMSCMCLFIYLCQHGTMNGRSPYFLDVIVSWEINTIDSELCPKTHHFTRKVLQCSLMKETTQRFKIEMHSKHAAKSLQICVEFNNEIR